MQEQTDLPHLQALGYQAASSPFPADSGRKTAWAKEIYELFRTEDDILIYLNRFQPFPSSGHLPLLRRLRQALGEVRSLEEYPGHLFSKSEADDIVSLMVLSLQFFWDCLVVPDSGKVVLSISHDEHCDCLASDQAALSQFQTITLRFRTE